MPHCKKCRGHFPNTVLIEGKRRNLSSRKYCLECSPFGLRNTCKLHSSVRPESRNWLSADPCVVCNSTTNKKPFRTGKCFSCINKQNETIKGDRLYGITGEACWICGYSKGRPMLDFHHLQDKDSPLTIRNIGASRWEKVESEARKCILVCCRCHREIHNGLISDKTVKELHKNKWEDIDSQAMREKANPLP